MSTVKSSKTKTLFALALFFLCFTFAIPMQTQAAGKKTKAIKAYQSFLTKIRKKDKKSQFAIAYIDKDDIPELYVKYTKREKRYGKMKDVMNYELYTYAKNKVVLVDDFKNAHGYNKHIRHTYFKKKGVYTDQFYFTDVGHDVQTYYTLKNHKKTDLIRICYGNIRTGITIHPFQLKQKSATPSEFKTFLNKYTKGKKETTVKFINNTAKNAKKKVK